MEIANEADNSNSIKGARSLRLKLNYRPVLENHNTGDNGQICVIKEICFQYSKNPTVVELNKRLYFERCFR